MILFLLLSVLQSAPAPAPTAALEMQTYQMVFLRAGATAVPQGPEGQKLQQEHLAGLAELNRQRLNVLYGPFLDDGELRGIGLFDVKDAADAKRLMADDPYVKAGIMTVDVRPWLGPKGWFADPPDRDVTHPGVLEQFVFGFLVNGPNRSQARAEAAEIQKGHLAYMEGLQAKGKLVAAGPFMDEGEARGIVIYRVATVDEARQLASGDPAVKAGRLTIDAHPWMTLKGILK